MSWTKRQFVNQAFDELGYASYAYSLPEDQINVSKQRLDSMMGTWNGLGIRLGYPLQSNQTSSDIDTETEVPDYAFEAIYTNLAIRIAPSIGKAVPKELLKSAREAYKILLLRSKSKIPQQFPDTLPRGAGNKPWLYDDNYFPTPDDNIELFEGDGELEF